VLLDQYDARSLLKSAREMEVLQAADVVSGLQEGEALDRGLG
jgi:hypothetical protein